MEPLCDSVENVAKFCLSVKGFKPLSNLRLQRLLYFLQGYSYQRVDRPLFPESFEVWTKGPAIRECYGSYMSYGLDPIPSWLGTTVLHVNEGVDVDDVKEYILKVFKWADKYRTGNLVAMAMNQNSPWFAVWNNGLGKYSHIPEEYLRKYFRSVDNEEKKS